ncbi:SIMPL domain-containing protein [Parvularcula sp. ZS-1/3]|uniref:SIMPL domain-containing protein n=1 Tax=Parvularcula mediterranea TaxID=2732508 RepID=A0A7Y3RMS1_9PROT|nr:SIMPL domain-containing protein [Parvularcula mediterranea]NNU16894.1 SIMPL domain-containing protein [Parvularcula mediterranea]
MKINGFWAGLGAGAVIALLAITGWLPNPPWDKGSKPKGSKEMTVYSDALILLPAEGFIASAELSGYGTSQEEAVASLSGQLSALRSELGRLEGLESLSFEADELDVQGYKQQRCEGVDGSDQRRRLDSCPPSRYVASVLLAVTAAPAREMGNVIALGTDLTDGDFSFDQYIMIDQIDGRARAIEKAIATARAEAEVLSAASGLKLGRVLEVDPQGAAPSEEYDMAEDDVIVVSASRIAPKYELDLDDPKLPIEVSLGVTFAVEPIDEE